MLVFHCCTVFCKWNMSLCSSLLFSRWDLWAESWTQQWQERQEERSCEEGDCQHDSRQGCEVGLRRWTTWYKRVQSISRDFIRGGHPATNTWPPYSWHAVKYEENSEIVYIILRSYSSSISARFSIGTELLEHLMRPLVCFQYYFMDRMYSWMLNFLWSSNLSTHHYNVWFFFHGKFSNASSFLTFFINSALLDFSQFLVSWCGELYADWQPRVKEVSVSVSDELCQVPTWHGHHGCQHLC